MKLWLPRFSLRTLAIVITLICVYFSSWELTKKYGVEKTPGVTKTRHSALVSVSAGSVLPETITVASESPAPFIVSRCVYHFEYVAVSDQTREYSVVNGPIHYYLWLFGAQFKLPFESTW